MVAGCTSWSRESWRMFPRTISLPLYLVAQIAILKLRCFAPSGLRRSLLDGYAFCQVAGLVYVAAAADGDVVREELQGHDFEDGEEQLGRGGDVDDVFDEVLDLAVALGGDGDDAAGAGGDLLNVGEGFFVLEDGGGVVGVLGGDADDGEGLVDECVGAVLHLAGGVAFGVDVGDLLELEGAFEGDGVVDAAAEEEEVAGVIELLGERVGKVVGGAEDVFELAGD